MSFEERNRFEELEEQLRAGAPVLPPALKARTLARCAMQVKEKHRLRERGSKRLVWALATVFVFQWVVVSLLDSQQAMIASSTPVASQQYADISATKNSPANLHKALRMRSQTLSALMADGSEWWISPESG